MAIEVVDNHPRAIVSAIGGNLCRTPVFQRYVSFLAYLVSPLAVENGNLTIDLCPGIASYRASFGIRLNRRKVILTFMIVFLAVRPL